MSQHTSMLSEWESDWRLSGRSLVTVRNYVYSVRGLLDAHDLDSLDLATVKAWVADPATPEQQRFRARSARAFLRWATAEGLVDAPWWERIPLPAVAEAPQETVTVEQATAVLTRATCPRDRALVAVLWSSGMRVSEILRMQVDHLDLDGRCVLVPESKGRRPRTAPLDPRACKALRVLLRRHPGTGPLWLGRKGTLTVSGVAAILRRLNAPPAHAWRRGWAVEALRLGISQVSVQAAGGWRSGSMVARYCRGLVEELSMDEFSRRWAG